MTEIAIGVSRHLRRPGSTGRSVVHALHGMVATSHPLAALVGVEMLKRGGTAVDAAIAVNAALGLVEPMSCGIGGDLYAIVWDAKTQKLHGLNASGRSPYATSLKFFTDKGLTEIPEHGPLSWSVPGCVSGWEELHKRFGKLPLTEILTPSILYAEEGLPVSEVIASHFAGSAKTLTKIPDSAQVYYPGGK